MMMRQADIARYLGVSRQRVNVLINEPRYKFPKAWLEFESGSVWRKVDVDQWKKDRPALTGGPKRS